MAETMKTAYSTGDDGTEVITKRALLKRIEALEARLAAVEVRQPRMTIAEIKETGDLCRRFPATAAATYPPGWPTAMYGGTSLPTYPACQSWN